MSSRYQDLHALFQRCARLNLLVVGDLMLDTYRIGETTRLCSEAPVPVVHQKEVLHLPGGAANTAANVRALGAEVMLVGLLGNDLTGEHLRSTLQNHAVSDRWLVVDEMYATQQKTRILANGQHLLRLDSGQKRGHDHATSSPSSLKRRLRMLKEAYLRCDGVIISDYGYGTLADAVVEHLLTLQATRPVPLLVDSKTLLRFREFPATVVTPNYHEACALVGLPASEEIALQEDEKRKQVEQMAQQVSFLLRAESLAITLGKDGVFLAHREGWTLHLPAYASQRASDVGAGDTFAAAMGLSLAAESSLQDAAHLALAAAHLAVSQPYTSLATASDVLRLLEEQPVSAPSVSRQA